MYVVYHTSILKFCVAGRAKLWYLLSCLLLSQVKLLSVVVYPQPATKYHSATHSLPPWGGDLEKCKTCEWDKISLIIEIK